MSEEEQDRALELQDSDGERPNAVQPKVRDYLQADFEMMDVYLELQAAEEEKIEAALDALVELVEAQR